MSPGVTVCLEHASKLAAFFMNAKPWSPCAPADFLCFAYPFQEMDCLPYTLCGLLVLGFFFAGPFLALVGLWWG